MKQFVMILGKGRVVQFTFIAFLIVMVAVFSGCSKEKTGELKGTDFIGNCDISNKRPSDIKTPFEVNYGNKVKLIGVTVDKLSQNQLRVVYFWQLLDEIEPYQQVFVHFSDTGDQNLFGNDHPFCQQKPSRDLKGKFVKESFMINVPESAKGKVVYIKIGLYAPNLKTGPRLQIESRGTIPADDGNSRAIVEKVNL